MLPRLNVNDEFCFPVEIRTGASPYFELPADITIYENWPVEATAQTALVVTQDEEASWVQ